MIYLIGSFLGLAAIYGLMMFVMWSWDQYDKCRNDCERQQWAAYSEEWRKRHEVDRQKYIYKPAAGDYWSELQDLNR